MQDITKIKIRYSIDLGNLNRYLKNTNPLIRKEVLELLPQIKTMSYKDISQLNRYYMTIHILFMYKQLYADVQLDIQELEERLSPTIRLEDCIDYILVLPEYITTITDDITELDTHLSNDKKPETYQETYETLNILNTLNIGPTTIS